MLTSIQLRCKSQKHHILIDPHKPHKYKLTQISKIFKGPLTLTHKTKSYILTPAHTQSMDYHQAYLVSYQRGTNTRNNN